MSESDRTSVVTALRDRGAVFALVFGSRGPGGTPRPDSDLDVAAWWLTEPPAAWEVALPSGVDLLVLNEAPLELAGRVGRPAPRRALRG